MANISSNVLYVEPNYIYSHGETYDSYNSDGELIEVEGIDRHEEVPPLEDYCVAFRLTVEVPQPVQYASTNTANTVFRLSWNSGEATSVSLLQGTRILSDQSKLDSTSINYLTTAALETTLEDVKKESPMEMFGVKSIDVSYDAWTTPVITMTFTDVRGASLFVPEELRHPYNGLAQDSNGHIVDVAGSFFKCFFTMPMPLFGLLMKGFYGEAVAYELKYSDVSYKLDSASGNYDVTVKFVGYTFSVLGDISFNAVACAPYSENWGKTYWENEIKKGRFVTDDGLPMPTLAQVMNAYKNLKELTSPIAALDGTTQRNATLNEKTKTLQNQMDAIATNITTLYNVSREVFGEERVLSIKGNEPKYGFVVLLGGEKVNNEEGSLGQFINNDNAQSAYTALRNDLIDGFAQTNTLLFKISIDDISGYETLGKLTSFKDLGKVIFTRKTDSSLETTLTQKDKDKESLFYMDVSVAKSLANKNSGMLKETGNYYGFIINAVNWFDDVSKTLAESKNELERNEEELRKAFQQSLANAIGMAPTLYNIVRLLMAHLETVVHCVYMCMDAVKASQRTIETTGLNQTAYVQDYCSKLGDSQESKGQENKGEEMVLPPFPEVKSYVTRDDIKRIEDDWLGDLSNGTDMFEVNLVESLLKGVALMNADFAAKPQVVVENEDGTKFEGNVFCPIVPSDVLSSKLIFDIGSLDGDNICELIGAIALRGAYVIHALQDICKEPKTAGELDALNMYKAYETKLPRKWLEFLVQVNEDEFVGIFNDIVYNDKPSGEGVSYTAQGLTWTKATESALLNENCYPILPKVTAKDGTTTLYAAPINSISFSLQPYTDGNGTTTDWYTYAPFWWNPNNEKYMGESMLEIVTGPNIFMNVERCFEEELVKNVSKYKSFKDNVSPLKKEANLGKKFKEMYYESHYYFIEKYSASPQNENKSVSVNKRWKGTYTLPISKADAQKIELVDSSFSIKNVYPEQNTNGVIAVPRKNFYVNCLCYDGNKVVTATRAENDIGEFITNDGLTISKSQIDNWTIPAIYGLIKSTDEHNGRTTSRYSLFSQQTYYKFNKKGYCRPALFLSTLMGVDNEGRDVFAIRAGIKVNECLKRLMKGISADGQDGIFKVLPYPFILYVGAYISLKNKGHINNNHEKEHYKWLTATYYRVFKENACKFIKNLPIVIQRRFSTEFENWADGKTSTIEGIDNLKVIKWPDIQKAFELPDTKADKNSGFEKKWAQVFNHLAQLMKEDNGETKSCEQHLAEVMDDAFFENYITLRINANEKTANQTKYEGTALLFTRETSEVVNRLTEFYVTPVMVVPFQSRYGLDGKDGADGETPKEIMETYVRGFHYRMNEILKGKGGSTDVSGLVTMVNADVDKHIKIALYKYLKLIHDRWASSDIFVSDDGKRDHWDLENFFDEHFHFIDQFYIDCKDIFFDLSDAYDMFVASFSNQNMSLFDYMSRALAKCRATMYPVQNFLNYYETDGQKKMENLFKPLSYIEAFSNAKEPHEIYPDFVVLYQSEESKNANGDGCDDSFMLNADEVFLPIPIRTNPGISGGVGKRIPCFGVSYGKQYQSYFHSIDVSTDSPLPTEQAFQAQYMIAGGAGGLEDAKQIGTIGQDLYTIYSNNSYTCTVQMMGDMWIQPTMYFVLTNVPTFRGSYMIQKVTHQMTPGRMTTTFTGTRMANTSQPHVYNWFVGKSSQDSGVGGSTIDSEGRLANLDNDCAYKVFAPGAANGTMGWTEEMLNATLGEFIKNPEWDVNKKFGDSTHYKDFINFKMSEIIAGICFHEDGNNPLGLRIVATGLFNNYLNNGPSVWEWFRRYYIEGITKVPSQINTLSKDHDAYVGSREVFTNSPACLVGQQTASPTKQAIEVSKEDKVWSMVRERVSQSSSNGGDVLTYDMLAHMGGWAWPNVYKKSAYPHLDEVIDVSNSFCHGYHFCYADKTKTPKWNLVQKTEGDVDDTEKKLKDLAESIKQTCAYSNGINIDPSNIKYEIDDTKERLLMWCGPDKNSPSQDNATLYDVALNAYSEYHDITTWVVSDINSGGALPIHIMLRLKALQNDGKSYRDVDYIGEDGTYYVVPDSKDGTLNDYFYRATAKKFLADNDASLKDAYKKSFFTICHSMKDLSEEEVVSILTKYRPNPCFNGNAFSTSSGPIVRNTNANDTAAFENINGAWWIDNGSTLPPTGDYGLKHE